MESKKNNTVLPIQDDEILSKFRKRNKILITIFLSLFIILTLIIAALLTHLIHDKDDDQNPSQSDDLGLPIPSNPAIQTYYASACYTSTCRKILNPILSTKSISDPNQIFIISLQTASKHLQNLTSLMNSTDIITFKNCSIFIRHANSRINDTLAIMRVSPFVQSQSESQRSEMRSWIMGVEESLDSCVDDLEKKVESTAVIEVRGKVHEVGVYVSSSRAFLLSYAEIMEELTNGVDHYGDLALKFIRGMDPGFVFGLCMCGLQLSFIFSVVWSLCRNR